jgi:predicted Zn finger-like uncharacterized protein
MKFTCDQCSTRYSISDEKVEGKVLKIRCKVCDFTMVVRGNDSRVGGSLGSSMSVASVMMEPVYEIEWYAAPDGQQIGPVPIERIRAMIRSGIIRPDTVLWNENLENWSEARQIDALKSMFPAPAPKGPPPLPTVDIPAPFDRAPLTDGVEPLQQLADKTMPSAARLESAQQISLTEDGDDVIKAAPIRGSDTLQYESPDVSEPVHSQSEGLLRPGQIATMQSMTQDLGDPSEPDLTSMNLLEDMGSSAGAPFGNRPTAVETEAYPPVTQDQSADEDRTELLDLAALIPMVEAAPVRDAETRKIEREDGEPHNARLPSDGPDKQPDVSETPPSLTPVSDLLLADPRHEIGATGDSDFDPLIRPLTDSTESVLGESAIQPPLHSLMSDRVSHSFLEQPDIADEPVSSLALEVPVPIHSPEDSEEEHGVINFAQPSALISPVVAAPAAVPTERHDGPKSRGVRTPISPGLVVAACLIGMAGMFSVVFYFAKKKPISTASKSGVAIEKIAPVTQPVGINSKKTAVPPQTEATKPVQQTPVARDAGIMKEKPSTQDKTIVTPKQVERKKIVKPKRVSKKRIVTEPAETRKNTRTPDRPESRTLAKFMTKRGGPSSAIRDPMIDARMTANKGRVSKGLSQNAVTRVVSRYIRAMNGCYTRQLKQDPTYNPGRLTLRFQIRPTGRTAQLKIVKKNREVLSEGLFLTKCLKQLIKRWSFPTFQGKPFETEFPIVFKSRF